MNKPLDQNAINPEKINPEQNNPEQKKPGNLNLGKFNADPRVSWTLPGHLYFDEAIYNLEMERIFYRNWQYICHQSALANAGDYHVRDIGDQSILVLRDQQDELKAYYNVCQHRAHRLLEGQGKTGKLITCPYHAWCYSLDGSLQAAPGSDGVKLFPREEIQLHSVRVDSICGFVFINMDENAQPMEECYPGLEQDILALAPDAANLQCAHTQEFVLAANWKNSVENYSECYHCPKRHPSLVQGALDIDQYRIHLRQGYHRHVTRDVGDSQGYQIDSAGSAEAHEFGSWFVWPNMVFEVYPGGNLTVFHHVPAGTEITRQETEWYFQNPQPSREEWEIIDFINTVREEDIPICESVQRGLHSKGYSQGRFIVDQDKTYVSEHAVHDFQLKVAQALTADKPGQNGRK